MKSLKLLWYKIQVAMEMAVQLVPQKQAAEFVMIPYPLKGPKGESSLLVTVQGRGKLVLNTNTEEEKVYRMLEWLDWWITEEGTTVMKDGPEGEVWEKDADGNIVLTENGKDYPEQINLLNNWIFRASNADFNEGIANIIAGRKPADYIDEVIARWKADGGDKIIEEVNESYQRQKANK